MKYEQRKALGIRGEDVANEIRKRVTDLSGMSVEVREPESGPPIGKSVQVQLTSHDPAVLDQAADLIKAKLAWPTPSSSTWRTTAPRPASSTI